MTDLLNNLKEIKNPYNGEELNVDYFIRELVISGNKVELKLLYPGLDQEKNKALKFEITKKIKIELGFEGVKIVEIKNNISENTKIIAILSGKGGVGKSNAVVNMAKSLVKSGKKVGIIDCDIYGYSIPKILNMYDTPKVVNNFITPLKSSEGIEMISTQYFIENNENKAVVWRGPILKQVMDNFFLSTDFSKDLDYMFIDMPPGTGDIMLNLKDYVDNIDSILVTTPSIDAAHVAIRSAELAQKLNFNVLGVIENMSYYMHNDEKLHIFGTDGYEEIAKAMQIPLLGQVPITHNINEAYDQITSDLEANYAKRSN